MHHQRTKDTMGAGARQPCAACWWTRGAHKLACEATTGCQVLFHQHSSCGPNRGRRAIPKPRLSRIVCTWASAALPQTEWPPCLHPAAAESSPPRTQLGCTPPTHTYHAVHALWADSHNPHSRVHQQLLFAGCMLPRGEVAMPQPPACSTYACPTTASHLWAVGLEV